LAALYTEGFPINWSKIYPGKGKYIQLPPVTWQRQRYWLEQKAITPDPFRNKKKIHPLLGDYISPANSSSTFIWQTELTQPALDLLNDHRIGNQIVFPAAAYIEMALQCATQTGLNRSHSLSDFVFKEKMIVNREKTRFIQTIISPIDAGDLMFSVYSRSASYENWKLHASALFKQQLNSLERPLHSSRKVMIEQDATKL
jgi:acyl transferase domain-containing protein